MKFLLFSLLLCLVAGALANVEDAAEADGALTEDFSTVTTTEVQTKRYKLTWLENFMQGMQAGGAPAFPPIEGSANAIVTGVLETARGSLKGLEPSIQAIYVTPLPTVRIILAGSKIKVCGPQTHLEYLLNHIICFVNGPLHLGLGVSPLPVCIKGREKQCHGPYMRLPDTLTPDMISKGTMGLTDGDWGVKDVALQEIDEEGDKINEVHVGEHEGNPDSSLPVA